MQLVSDASSCYRDSETIEIAFRFFYKNANLLIIFMHILNLFIFMHILTSANKENC